MIAIRSGRRVRVGVTITVLSALIGSGPACAAQFTIDAKAASIGSIVTDAAGNGYVAWEQGDSGGAAIPMVCRLAPAATKCADPVALALPGGTESSANTALNLFPIVGPGQVVWVVTSRYIRSDTVIWTSVDGGKTFGSPAVIPAGSQCLVGAPCQDSVPYTGLIGLSDSVPITPGGDTYDGQSDIDAVGSPFVTFLQSSNDPGLGWDWDATDVVDQFEPNVSEFDFNSAASYVDITDSALGTTTTGDVVEAYTDDASSGDAIQYFYYTPTAAHPSVLSATQAGWTGPVNLADNYDPRMADGSAGLFMVASSDPNQNAQTYALYKWNPTTHGFGVPSSLGPVSSDYTGEGEGVGENYKTGELATVWPTESKSGGGLMSLRVSTNGGSSFTAVQDIATVASEYGGDETARVAVANDGTGFVTWEDSKGLEIADLDPIAAQFKSLHPVKTALPVPLSCSAPHPCTAKLVLTGKLKASGTFHLDAGTSRSLRLKLSATALAHLHSHPLGTLKLTLTSGGTTLYRLVLRPRL